MALRNRIMSVRGWATALALGALPVSASADELLFKNGDRLTGTIMRLEGGKLFFTSAVAGKITVDIGSLKTFSSEQPIEMHLTDQTVIKQRVAAAGDGSVAVPGDGAAAGRAVPFSALAMINPPPPPPVKWTGSVRAGALLSRGNSRTDSMNAGFDATRRSESDRLSLGAGYLFRRQRDQNTGDDTTTTDAWNARAKYDYFVTKKLYGYANVKVEKDRIAELKLRLTPGVGVGYQWIEGPKQNFLTEAGVTWVHERYTDPDEIEEHMALRAAYRYDRKLTETLKLCHNLECLPSLERADTFLVNADIGLRSDFTKVLFGEAKVVYNYNSQPAADAEKDDVKYVLGLGWSF